MNLQLEDQFHTAMLGIYQHGLQLHPPYKATRFHQMVQSRGGKAAADTLLATGNPSTGFTELFVRGKENLKFSVEYLVLERPWRSLFSESQLAEAEKRLRKVGVTPPDAST